MAHESYESFDQVKARLDEIVDAVGSSEMPLDEALSLYEEAVGLGLRASELLEENIEARDAEDDAEDGAGKAVCEAAAKVYGAPVPVTGCSRTDAGVHAHGQVAHCDVPDARARLRWQRSLNALLPPEIEVGSKIKCEYFQYEIIG